jgi:hypothetical protein
MYFWKWMHLGLGNAGFGGGEGEGLNGTIWFIAIYINKNIYNYIIE